MSGSSQYDVYVFVGPERPSFPKGTVLDITPAEDTPASAIEAIRGTDISSADLRSQVLFVTTTDPAYRLKATLAYVALLGLSRRRVDIAVGMDSEPLVMSNIDTLAQGIADSGKPEIALEVGLYNNPDVDLPPSAKIAAVELGANPDPDMVSHVRYAKRLVMGDPGSVSQLLQEFVLLSAMRARAGRERLPFLASDGIVIDTEEVRRTCQDLRKELRGDDRTTVLPEVTAPVDYDQMTEAAAYPIVQLLERLGAKYKTVESHVLGEDGEPTSEVTTTTLWHCPLPQNHTNGDATPSARVSVSDAGIEGFRCYRCLPDRVDSLRLAMWVCDLTGDEAADLILSEKPVR